jgi:methylated-DNA-protein-cysteine methyltransferase-like protein
LTFWTILFSSLLYSWTEATFYLFIKGSFYYIKPRRELSIKKSIKRSFPKTSVFGKGSKTPVPVKSSFYNRHIWYKKGGQRRLFQTPAGFERAPEDKTTESTLRIINALKSVAPGRVSSYRDIALAAGIPNGARQVAQVLHSMSQTQNLPWHRIIRADGRIALPWGGGREEQIALLRAEGVRVSDAGEVSPAFYR